MNTAGQYAHECISALSGNTGSLGPVCEGYARVFKVLCDKMGIPCVLVDGYALNSPTSSGEAHMWNYVQVGGAWYAVDVTWNDPTVSGKSDRVSGYEREDYFLVGSETEIAGMPFITSHPVSNTVSSGGVAFTNGPELSKDKYDASAAAHEHVWTYKADDEQDIITAVCTGTAGSCDAGSPSAQMTAPENLVYDGTEKTAVLSGTVIRNVSITVKKTEGYGTVSMESWIYGQAAKTPVASGSGAVTYLYESTDGRGYSSDAVPADAGAYRVTATFAETQDSAQAVAAPENLTATCGQTLSEIALPAHEQGVWSWVNPQQTVGDAGVNVHAAVFAPNNADLYASAAMDVSIAVSKLDAAFVGGLKAYLGETETSAFTYGDVITVKASVSVGGPALLSLRSLIAGARPTASCPEAAQISHHAKRTVKPDLRPYSPFFWA